MQPATPPCPFAQVHLLRGAARHGKHRKLDGFVRVDIDIPASQSLSTFVSNMLCFFWWNSVDGGTCEGHGTLWDVIILSLSLWSASGNLSRDFSAKNHPAATVFGRAQHTAEASESRLSRLTMGSKLMPSSTGTTGWYSMACRHG